jgi:hypothetical protein
MNRCIVIYAVDSPDDDMLKYLIDKKQKCNKLRCNAEEIPITIHNKQTKNKDGIST